MGESEMSSWPAILSTSVARPTTWEKGTLGDHESPAIRGQPARLMIRKAQGVTSSKRFVPIRMKSRILSCELPFNQECTLATAFYCMNMGVKRESLNSGDTISEYLGLFKGRWCHAQSLAASLQSYLNLSFLICQMTIIYNVCLQNPY